MEPLDQFLVGYLNQDFDLIFGDPEDAVRAFATKDPAIVADARRGLQLLLREHGHDRELLAAAVARGCEFEPEDPAEFRALLEFAVRAWAEPVRVDPDEPLRTFMGRYLSADMAGVWSGPDHPARDFTSNGRQRVALARAGVAALLSMQDDQELEGAARECGWGGLPAGAAELRVWLHLAVAVWEAFLAEQRITA